ncbi:hypothetical protein AciM339_1465 [Aciduliprofundum sp. MAR08-339]|uniref:hypothetical protein n=1 Tax=Aciduliprofundum sp. (strain MAR08-339) TaxID=673860 RepID=UPI0002A485C3|nr:hypothetical protein AciM339_1465 [Aciduliprofundum sp. MAR08-339]
MLGPLPKQWVEGKDVEERIKFYKFVLYAQVVSTVLIALGLILFILIVAGIIKV